MLSSVSPVITGADGTFSYAVAPKILTTYRAKWKTASSLLITTAVAPAISFGRNNGFVTRVYAGRSMIIDPVGVPVAQLADAEGVALAEVTAERVHQVRARMPCLDHRRFRVEPGRPEAVPGAG